MIQCNASRLSFHSSFSRLVQASFDGAAISSDCGALLLREIESHIGIINRFAAAFTDHRDPARTRHDIPAMLAQRVFAIACGHEDINDHADLRADPLYQLLADRRPGSALASPSTLNRLDLDTTDIPLHGAQEGRHFHGYYDTFCYLPL